MTEAPYLGTKRPRRLRVFAFDPTAGRDFKNRAARYVTISLPHDLDPDDRVAPKLGPSGEYLEVIDYDPASRVFYAPIDLNADAVQFDDGLPPSPENPKFHQQMVYAVAMNTIAVFEEALGRRLHWAPVSKKSEDGLWEEQFVQRLRIYPHALREANAFYNPDKKALLFGYFTADAESAGAPPGTTVFTCLSHDIVVHETVHAILDGLHPRFAENSGPDMRALHEAFADIIALFQLFSFPEVLEDQIAKTRGDLGKQSILGQLAQEFGLSVGRGHALRDFLGQMDRGEWTLRAPDKLALDGAEGPHARGAVLVAAVFRAFLTIYKTRVSDLFRIASNGSGILRSGEIDPDLKKRLAAEAAQCARRVMRICIRAMDYVPPVNVSFGDYFRAIITADRDLFPEDKQGYRDAFIEAFTAWGIVPAGMPILSEPALCWPDIQTADRDRQASRADAIRSVDLDEVSGHIGMLMSNPRLVLEELCRQMRDDAGLPFARKRQLKLLFRQTNDDLKQAARAMRTRLMALATQRKDTASTVDALSKTQMFQTNVLDIGATLPRCVQFHVMNHYKRLLWFLLTREESTPFAQLIGIEFDKTAPLTVLRSTYTDLPSLHVHAVRIATRMGQRGQLDQEYVIELIQSRHGFLDPADQAAADAGELPCDGSDFIYRAGTTFLIDTRTYKIRRLIRTPFTISDDRGVDRQRAHLRRIDQAHQTAFFGGHDAGSAQAFTDLHRHTQSAGDGTGWPA
ncbi:hypothetical protein [Litoreibacter roseus]|uniref:Peptidase M4 n=1 Tax=Litoreibacter roseus TaxID=2601869 RepID=A0A6N6JEJ1_9RHOB|nr:hypothetical protein [Litoreibacter roseus]GFE64240.1 hypothetical protein KIN_13140 [Litoreibacter roseus]